MPPISPTMIGEAGALVAKADVRALASGEIYPLGKFAAELVSVLKGAEEPQSEVVRDVADPAHREAQAESAALSSQIESIARAPEGKSWVLWSPSHTSGAPEGFDHARRLGAPISDEVLSVISFLRSRKLLDRTLVIDTAGSDGLGEPRALEHDESATGQLGALLLEHPFQTLSIGNSASISDGVAEIARLIREMDERILRKQDHRPPSSHLHGWDSLVDPWVDSIPVVADKIPSAYRIWLTSRRYYLAGDLSRAARAEQLNYLLHNSYVPYLLDLKDEVNFGYGGIGVVIHKDSDIGVGVTIGANVTIGGNGSRVRLSDSGGPVTVPKIEPYVYLGAGVKVLGGVTVGAFSIVGPNSVVTRDLPAGSVAVGAPARVLRIQSATDALQSKGKYPPLRRMSDSEFLKIARRHLENEGSAESVPSPLGVEGSDSEVLTSNVNSKGLGASTPTAEATATAAKDDGGDVTAASSWGFGSTADAQVYARDYRDSIIGSWRVELLPGDMHRSVTPNGSEFEEIHGQEQWSEVPEDQGQSAMLWRFSLGNLAKLAYLGAPWESVERSLSSFRRFASSDEGILLFASMTSLDHCLAARIRNLILLKAVYCGRDDVSLDVIDHLIEHAIELASAPGYIKNNNHGMMLAAALVHAAVIRRPQRDGLLLSFATESLVRTVQSAFDEFGYCNENTPAYHRFYIVFLKQMLEFSESFDVPDAFPPALFSLLENAELAIRKLCLPDGDLPPHGDGALFPEQYPSIDGIHFSPSNGFYIRKDGTSYLSVKCGYASVTHKQVDDTSLTLWRDGEFLFTDAGLHNYDWKNETTVSVKSQRGHSGLFFRSLDDVYPATVYRPGREMLSSSLSVEGPLDGVHRVVAKVEVFGKGILERTLSEISDSGFLISDSWDSLEGETPTSRFLVPASCAVRVSGSSVTVQGLRSAATLSWSSETAVVVHYGVGAPDMKGWVSPALNSIEPAYLVELTPRVDLGVAQFAVEFGPTL